VETTICVFANAPGSPLKPWLRSSEVRCFPGSSVVAFPNGDWSFYATQPGHYASVQAHRFVVDDDPQNTDTGFKQVQIELAPAGKAVLPKRDGPRDSGRVALYFPRTTRTLPSVVPATPDQAFFTVPIGLPFIPIEYGPGGRLIRLGNLHQAVTPDDVIVLSELDGPVTTDILSYVFVNCRPKDLTGAKAHELPPPTFSLLTADGKRQAPVVPVGPIAEDDLIIFKNVQPAAASATIEATGPAWEPTSKSVTVIPNAVAVSLPVELAPAGMLRLTLSPNAADWLQTITAKPCHEAGSRPSEVLLQLFRSGSESALRTAAVRSADDRLFVFDQLPPGKYDISINVIGYRNVFRKSVVLKTGEQTVAIEPDLYKVSGTVTRQGSPVQASLQFNDLTVGTNPLGWYSAYLPSGAAFDRVTITECEGGAHFVVFPPSDAHFTNVLDFDLPVAHAVRVMDDDTSKPIGNARVTVSVSAPGDPHMLLYNEGQRTDDGGNAALTATPIGKFRVCAKAEGYAEICKAAEHKGDTELRLHREAVFVGTIVGAAPVGRAAVLFTTSEGLTTEAVPVRQDGTFSFNRAHGPNEFVVFVSADHPLYLLPVPATTPLVVTLPPAPIRTIDIMAAGDDEHEIGIAIGGNVVPSAALSRHQAAHGAGTFTVAGRLTIAEIAETAPITAYKGFPAARPVTVPPSIDAFARPELLATFSHRRVPANSNTVVLP
jgi:hypothetical protein